MAARPGSFYDAPVQARIPAEQLELRVGRPLRLGSAVAVAALALVAGSRLARAQGPQQNTPVVQDDAALDPDEGLPRPAAKDWRTGHVLLSGRFGLVSPTGSVASVGPTEISEQVPIQDVATTGMNFGGTLGLGVSRHAVLEATVDYSKLGAPVGCTACFGKQITLALGFSYHLAQGIALDPWVSYAVGFRFSTYHAQDELTSVIHDVSFRGIDVARIALGADFYPISTLGIGPFFEIDAGTNVSFPADTVTFAGSSVEGGYSPAPYAMLQLGVRVTIDPLRYGAGSRPKATGGGGILSF